MNRFTLTYQDRNEGSNLDASLHSSFAAALVLDLLDPGKRLLQEAVNFHPPDRDQPWFLAMGRASLVAPVEELQDFCTARLARRLHDELSGSYTGSAERAAAILTRLDLEEDDTGLRGVAWQLAQAGGSSWPDRLRRTSAVPPLERVRRLVEELEGRREDLARRKCTELRHELQDLARTVPGPGQRLEVVVELGRVLRASRQALLDRAAALEQRREALRERRTALVLPGSALEALLLWLHRLVALLAPPQAAPDPELEEVFLRLDGEVARQALPVYDELLAELQDHQTALAAQAAEDAAHLDRLGRAEDVRVARERCPHGQLLFTEDRFPAYYQEHVEEALGRRGWEELRVRARAKLARAQDPVRGLVALAREEVRELLGRGFLESLLSEDDTPPQLRLARLVRESEPLVARGPAAGRVRLRIVAWPDATAAGLGRLQKAFQHACATAGDSADGQWLERTSSNPHEIQLLQMELVPMAEVLVLESLRDQYGRFPEPDQAWPDPLLQPQSPGILRPATDELDDLVLRGLLSGALAADHVGRYLFLEGGRQEAVGSGLSQVRDRLASSYRLRIRLWDRYQERLRSLGASPLWNDLDERSASFAATSVARLRRELVRYDAAHGGALGRIPSDDPQGYCEALRTL